MFLHVYISCIYIIFCHLFISVCDTVYIFFTVFVFTIFYFFVYCAQYNFKFLPSNLVALSHQSCSNFASFWASFSFWTNHGLVCTLIFPISCLFSLCDPASNCEFVIGSIERDVADATRAYARDRSKVSALTGPIYICHCLFSPPPSMTKRDTE